MKNFLEVSHNIVLHSFDGIFESGVKLALIPIDRYIIPETSTILVYIVFFLHTSKK